MKSSPKPAPGYELVIAVALTSFLVHHMYMPYFVVKARKKYGIEYPDLYATKDNCSDPEDAKAFNCVQRAHQSSLEGHGPILVMMTLAGLRHPMTAAAGGGVYVLGRLLHFHGYSSGTPKARRHGQPFMMTGLFAITGAIIKSLADYALS